MQGLWLGVDVGTQGTKGVVVDLGLGADTDCVVARASRSYGLIEGLEAGAAEQWPQTWWRALSAVIGELLSVEGVEKGRIRGMAVSGQQHGCVPLDRNGAVIRAAKLWCDTATVAEAEELSEGLGRPLPTGFTASKILWLKRHEPGHFARLDSVLLPHDWINYSLTGRRVTEAGDASGTGLFDVVGRRFDPEAAALIDERLWDCLPDLVPPDQVLGSLGASAARDLGLPPGLPVAPGGGDNMMSAIGSGAITPGVVVASVGTSGTVFTYSDAPVLDPTGLIAPFCDSTGAWLPLLCVMNLTGVLEELKTAFGMDHESLTRAARDVPAGCGGTLFLPYLRGERTPELPRARGTLLGLRAGSFKPGVLYRAALEGTAANLAWGVGRLGELGIAVDSVRLVGGGSHNPLWCEILAAFFGVPLQRLAEPESAALGAALQAAWVIGKELDLKQLVARAVRPQGPPLEADGELAGRYRDLGAEFIAAVGRTYQP